MSGGPFATLVLLTLPFMLAVLWPEALALVGMGAVILTLARLRSRSRLA